MEYVEIRWLDAAMHFGEYDPETPPGAECIVAGYIAKVTEDFITVALERGPDGGEFRQAIDIPIVNIIEVTELKKGKRLWTNSKYQTTERRDPSQLELFESQAS
jgi:hypothetical protein